MAATAAQHAMDAPEGSRHLCARVVKTSLCVLVVVSMTGIMVLTVANVFTRYFLAAPISGCDEIIEFLLAALIFAAFPMVTVERRHFSVSIVSKAARGRLGRISILLELLVSTAACGVMAVQLAREAAELTSSGMATMVLQLPLGAITYAMSAMAGIALVGMIVLLVEHVQRTEVRR